MSFHLEIPDGVVESLHLPPEEAERELRTDLALVLYTRGALSAGKAAEMCKLSRWAFEDLLAQRKIERPFSEADWEHDRFWSNHRGPIEAAPPQA
jgi:predicted HTH domain antitoxin